MCLGGGGGTKGFNRSCCGVMEWVQELVHCERGSGSSGIRTMQGCTKGKTVL